MPLSVVDSKESLDVADAPAKRGPRLNRPRSAKACQYCRSRKVRCDWVANGNPCTNCRLDSRHCITVPRKQQISRPRQHGKERRRKFKPMNRGAATSTLPTPSPSGSDRVESASPDSFVQSPVASEGIEADLPNYLSHGDSWSHNLPPSSSTDNFSWECHSEESISTRIPTVWHKSQPHPVQEVPSAPPVLPAYFHPLSKGVGPEDVTFLRTKGVFNVPERKLRNVLLRSYVDYVHPFLPVLDLEQYLQAIQTRGRSGKISLLLYHSVMFAAVPFVDNSVLHTTGLTRKDLQQAYFDRARLLYQFDAEVDRIVLVQALLHLTYCSETPRDIKDSWHWMSISISMARSAGLHQNPETLGFDSRTAGLRKRVWWSCYTRDRLIALSMRRPLLIQDEDCSVPMLQLQDFDTKSLSPVLIRLLGVSCSAADAPRRLRMAAVCVEKAKLCVSIGHILSTQYCVLSRRIEGDRNQATVTLVPKKSPSEIGEIVKCGHELSSWYKNLPEEAHYRSENAHRGKCLGVEKVHLATLAMTYFASTSALYRPHVLPSTILEGFPEMSGLSRRKVSEAACGIAKIAGDLLDLDLAVYLPSIGVTALLPAAVNHLLELGSVETPCLELSPWHFFQCIQVLQRLGERHAVAEQAVSFLASVIKKMNINEQVMQSEARNIIHEAGLKRDEAERVPAFPCTKSTISESCSEAEIPSQHSFMSEAGTSPGATEAGIDVNLDYWINMDEDHRD